MSILPTFLLPLLLTALPMAMGGWLGIRLEGTASRPQIAEVVPGSPAERAGLEPGDVILSVGDSATKGVRDLIATLEKHAPGDRLRVVVRRGEQRRTFMVKLGRPPADGARAGTEAPPRRVARRPAVRRTPPSPSVETRGGGQAVPFESDLTRAQARARAERRPLLLVFGAAWCAPCQALRRAMDDTQVAALRRAFVNVWIDTDEQSRLADRHGVQTLPQLEVLDGSGRTLLRSVGYRPPAGLRDMLARFHRSAPADRRPAGGRGRAAGRASGGGTDLTRLRGEVQRLRAEVKSLTAQLRRLLDRRR